MTTIRPAVDDDRAKVATLLRRSLGAGDDPAYDRFLQWKHRENPFGPSYEWVALEGETIIGYRAFLRWEFVVNGEPRPAVRAVDTATSPEHRGKGVFRELTMHAVDEMSADGVACVFNTPNDASRPGYLSMGWSTVGRIPVGVTARSPLVLRRLVMARQPAARWSEPITAYEQAVDVIDRIDDRPSDESPTWRTNRTAAFLRWRYGLHDLHYRSVCPRENSAVVFRVRRRGPLREALIADVIGAPVPRLGVVTRQIVRDTSADVAVIAGRLRPRASMPVKGPILTWRTLADDRTPTMADLDLCGGDVELF